MLLVLQILHEMSKPVSLWENIENIINLSSAELAQRLINVNIILE